MGKDRKIKQKMNELDSKIQEKEKSYLANRSSFGQGQKNAIEAAKKRYFIEKDSEINTQKALGALGIKLYNSYLPYIRDVYTPVYDIPETFREADRIVYFEITRWVNDTEEKNIDKLINVYQVLSGETCSIALIYDRKIDHCVVTMAIANTGKQSLSNIARDYRDRVIKAINGNFPGAEIREKEEGDEGFGFGIPQCLQDLVKYKDDEDKGSEVDNSESVAIVSNLATDKSEDFISQSMEKLLDGIVPKSEDEEYRLILLACPTDDVDSQKITLFDMYNALSPYASWQESISINENTIISAGSSLGKCIGVNAEFHAGTPFVGGGVGVNFGANFGKTANQSEMVGKNQGETKTCTNYAVKHSLELLENQIKRLEECSALGMWKFAAYAVSRSAVIAKNVATMYLALTQGETSYISQAAINYWNGTKDKDKTAVILETLKRIQHPDFVLDTKKCEENDGLLMFPEVTTLSTIISGKELVRALNFPRKSVAGFPVIDSVAFGRETQKFSIFDDSGNTMDAVPDIDRNDDAISIGRIVHMYRAENRIVKLDVNSLASHVFITGSTGTGKSNSIYQIIKGLSDLGRKYLVIEPAKGEYKMAFGKDCKVYGTNPKISSVLRINPFSFPVGDGVKKPIHVLEHIDRLTEILNACWPMYAAMPAVLKDAIEKAYVDKGWNLYSSDCDPLKFPTFDDLLATLPEVMKSSLYSEDTQSDYAGALVTRVKALTNGINGLVLCAEEELSDAELFEENVIVDISRVGSTETKALLMGVLIMKLQEYHMSSSGINEDLQHVTILEEAHNLLRRISVGQGQESVNLQGKSVEMLTNSIAEMRTYGEGFIIADQAPGLLDEAVIRNTNTKIILRLPDAEDRRLVGKAAALDDAQIEELARLPKGVAAVYQNDWVEAVLCKFERFECDYEYEPENIEMPKQSRPTNEYFKVLFRVVDNREINLENVDDIINWIDRLALPSSTKSKLRKVLMNEELSDSEMKAVAYNLFDGKRMARCLMDSIDAAKGIEEADAKIKKLYDIDDDLVVVIRQLVLQYIVEHMKTDSFSNRYLEYTGRRGM
ncbi:MAG: ATP-binding protein [Butyrivibrio sp.]|uniref:ATP-binding protein n=1 Tax=Butyrivibrio sp. TaxID=28121 RepID=UPI0025DD1C8E|nr:ATP-binding protein [Butyrivibrio sp.]MCR5771712.1 ATP-binding protein [Butyrivibrio sp.]